MIVDFDKNESLTEEQRLVTLRDSIQRALNEQMQINEQLLALIKELQKKVEK